MHDFWILLLVFHATYVIFLKISSLTVENIFIIIKIGFNFPLHWMIYYDFMTVWKLIEKFVRRKEIEPILMLFLLTS